ncbi:MAG: VOC family protein [Chloroflexi bacterium]|nr:VOC family protein [Chloroflexota bacterium]
MTVLRGIALDHIVLPVADVDRSLGFYRDLLQLSVEREADFRAGTRPFLSVRIGTSLIDLLPTGTQGRVLDHICLAVEGFQGEELVAWLRDHDVPVVRGPVQVDGARGSGSAVYVTDPDGHTVELKSYPS